MSMALDPAGRRLALEGGNRPKSAILSLADGHWATNVSSASPTILWTPGGDRLLRGAKMLLFETNGVLELVDERFQVMRRFDGTGGRAVLRPDGKRLATGPWGDQVRFWSWPGMEALGAVSGVGTVMAMAYSPDGRHLACASRDGQLRLIEAESGRVEAQRLAHGGVVIWSLAYSPDGTRLVTGGNDQTVVV